MPSDSTSEPGLNSIALIAIVMAVLVTGLVYGAPFLIPIVIAGLIVILLMASADGLSRLGLPEPFAMLSAVVLFIVVIAGVFNILAAQTGDVAQAWPGYVERFNTLAEQVLGWVGPELARRIRELVSEIDVLRRVPGLIGSAGSLAATVGLVLIYVGFLLAERGRLAPKIDRLASGADEAQSIKHAIDDIAGSIRRYLWIKTILSVLTAGISYAVLKALGVDFAETWALIIFLLNYIPSIGSVLGVVFPALLALIQFDTLWQFLIIATLLAGTQFVIGNVIEPRLMGRSLNLSPFVVIAALAFWGMIWGVIGAFLSVPMTTAFVIVCNHVPSLQWIAILLLADSRAAAGGGAGRAA
ncbi:MAG: AI-2E family transporter [Dichotomicrobium sp.]